MIVESQYQNTFLKQYLKCKTLDEKYDFIKTFNTVVSERKIKLKEEHEMIVIQNVKYHTTLVKHYTYFLKSTDWSILETIKKYLNVETMFGKRYYNEPEKRSVDLVHFHSVIDTNYLYKSLISKYERKLIYPVGLKKVCDKIRSS